MKYCLLILGVLLLCGCNQTPKSELLVDPYAHINVENVTKSCVIDENYQFPVFGIFMVVNKYEKCIKVDNLFVIHWYGEDSELQRTAVKFLTLLYVDSKMNTKTTKYESQFVKYESNKVGDKHTAFYKFSLIELPDKS